MTASGLGGIFGAFVGIYLVSRVFLWIIERLGDTGPRIGLAHGITLALSLVLWTFFPSGNAAGGEWIWLAYVLASAVWLAVDLVALKGRRASRTAEARHGGG